MNCDDKFGVERVGVDPRAKIMVDDGRLSWRMQDMNVATARECAARLALHLRMTDLYGDQGVSLHPDAGRMVFFEFFREAEGSSICIAHNYESGAVHASVNGITMFHATILLESFVFEMNKVMLGEIVTHGAAI